MSRRGFFAQNPRPALRSEIISSASVELASGQPGHYESASSVSISVRSESSTRSHVTPEPAAPNLPRMLDPQKIYKVSIIQLSTAI